MNTTDHSKGTEAIDALLNTLDSSLAEDKPLELLAIYAEGLPKRAQHDLDCALDIAESVLKGIRWSEDARGQWVNQIIIISGNLQMLEDSIYDWEFRKTMQANRMMLLNAAINIYQYIES